jgi:hypothetical protein
LAALLEAEESLRKTKLELYEQEMKNDKMAAEWKAFVDNDGEMRGHILYFKKDPLWVKLAAVVAAKYPNCLNVVFTLFFKIKHHFNNYAFCILGSGDGHVHIKVICREI